MTDDNPYPIPDPPYCDPDDPEGPLLKEPNLLEDAKKNAKDGLLREVVHRTEHKLGENYFLEADYNEEKVVVEIRLIEGYNTKFVIKALENEDKVYHRYMLIARLRTMINTMPYHGPRFRIQNKINSILKDIKME